MIAFGETKFEIYKGFIISRTAIETGGVLSQSFVDFIYNTGVEHRDYDQFMDLYHPDCYWMVLE